MIYEIVNRYNLHGKTFKILNIKNKFKDRPRKTKDLFYRKMEFLCYLIHGNMFPVIQTRFQCSPFHTILEKSDRKVNSIMESFTCSCLSKF